MTKKESKGEKKITYEKSKYIPPPENKDSIHIGNISGGIGFAIGTGAEANVTQIKGGDSDDVSRLFEKLINKLNESPQGPDKNIAENAIKALESEARNGEQADENNIQKWFNFLSDTAPDVWEVAIDMLINPIKGLGTVFMKVANKAKAERDAKKGRSTKK